MNIHTAFFASSTRSVINSVTRNRIIKEFGEFQAELDRYNEIESHHAETDEIKQTVESLIKSKLLQDEDSEIFIKSLTLEIDKYLKNHQGFAEACREFLSNLKIIVKNSTKAKDNLLDTVFGPSR